MSGEPVVQEPDDAIIKFAENEIIAIQANQERCISDAEVIMLIKTAYANALMAVTAM